MSQRCVTHTAAEVGLDAVTLAATRTGHYRNYSSAREICLLVDITYVAVTEVQIEMDWRAGQDDANDYEMNGVSTAQDATDTVATVKPMMYKIPVSAADKYVAVVLPVYASFGRIRVTDTDGGASDIVSVRVVELR